MRDFKKFLAATLAGVMVMSSSVVVGAANPSATATPVENTDVAKETTGSASGVVDVEGIVSNSAFSVKVPTSATGYFDIRLDPQGLIKTTNAAKDSGVSTSDIGTNHLLFVNIDGGADAATFKNASTKIKAEVQSNFKVDVSVKATLETTGVAVVAKEASAVAATVPTMYLAVCDGTSEEAVSADTKTAQLSKELAAALTDADFETKYSSGKYVSSVKDDSKTKKTSFEFWLKGDCTPYTVDEKEVGWTGDEEAKVDVVWSFAKHSDELTVADGGSITWSDTSKDLVFKVSDRAVAADFVTNINGAGTYYGITGVGGKGKNWAAFAELNGNTVTLKTTMAQYVTNGQLVYVYDATGAYSTITINR